MDILYLLIPLSVALVFAIAVVFWWSVRSGQFDDLEGPGFKVLMDDDGPDIPAARSAPEAGKPDKV
jgi:cbb3-type cytochrome oxidase maturation protein